MKIFLCVHRHAQTTKIEDREDVVVKGLAVKVGWSESAESARAEILAGKPGLKPEEITVSEFTFKPGDTGYMALFLPDHGNPGVYE